MAGLSNAGREARRLVDLPVPRPRAARRGRRPGRDGWDAAEVGEGLGREEREPLEAGDALLRRTDGRQVDRVPVVAVVSERRRSNNARLAQLEERALGDLALPELDVCV